MLSINTDSWKIKEEHGWAENADAPIEDTRGHCMFSGVLETQKPNCINTK